MGLNRKLKLFLADNKDFDFDRALKLQVIYSGLFLIKGIFLDNKLSQLEKLKELQILINQPELKEAFSNLNFRKIPKTLKIDLFLMKNRMAMGLLIFRNLILKTKRFGL